MTGSNSRYLNDLVRENYTIDYFLSPTVIKEILSKIPKFEIEKNKIRYYDTRIPKQYKNFFEFKQSGVFTRVGKLINIRTNKVLESKKIQKYINQTKDTLDFKNINSIVTLSKLNFHV